MASVRRLGNQFTAQLSVLYTLAGFHLQFQIRVRLAFEKSDYTFRYYKTFRFRQLYTNATSTFPCLVKLSKIIKIALNTGCSEKTVLEPYFNECCLPCEKFQRECSTCILILIMIEVGKVDIKNFR